MGVFSINESHFNIGSLPEVGMNEDYNTGTDMCVALFEAKENEYAVLEAGIKQDVVAAMCEDYEERLAINEATASGVMGKVKEILTKLLEKLKSIFHSFMAKINSFFMDSDKFFKRYSADIAKKDFKDFEIKARKFYPDRVNEIINTTKNLIPTANSLTNNAPNHKGTSTTVGDAYLGFGGSSAARKDKLMESDELGKFAKSVIFEDSFAKKIDDDLGNVAEEIEEYIFEDAETHDELRSTDILTSDWIGGLLNKKKFISDIEKCNKDNEKKVAKAISDLSKHINSIGKTLGKDGELVQARKITLSLNTDVSKKADYKNDPSDSMYNSGTTDETKSNAIASVAWVQAVVSKEQELLIKANNARLSCAKKGMAQARKIFAAAVAYNPKKEDYEFYTAVGESAEFEAIMAME